jgi:prevent-host-death family protein
MPKVISALTARTQFGQIIKRAQEKNERFLVDRRGEPAVVIMSVKDYVNTIAPAPDSLKEMWAEAKQKRRNTLGMREIDAEIKAYRREQRTRVRKPAA